MLKKLDTQTERAARGCSSLPPGLEEEAELPAIIARQLLCELGHPQVIQKLGFCGDHPAISWIRSGLMNATGKKDGPGLMAPSALCAYADAALACLRALAPAGAFDGITGAALLGERARISNLHRMGATSPGGGCQLLPTANGVLGVSLTRPSDWECLEAWLEAPILATWSGVADCVKDKTTAFCVERGRLLGLAVADASAPLSEADSSGNTAWYEMIWSGAPSIRCDRKPIVIDLSSLWAGPLCGDLLRRMGAEVIKVESSHRPDGQRAGNSVFFSRLNAGKSSVSVDFTSSDGRAALLALINGADIVIESARPRALRQLGLEAEAILARKPGLSWIAISGYGRTSPQEDWIAFGDDASVAAGLARLMRQVHGEWLFCGDAIADPLTGLHAALIAWSTWLQGGGKLQSMSLYQVMRRALTTDCAMGVDDLVRRTGRWTELAGRCGEPLYALPAHKA